MPHQRAAAQQAQMVSHPIQNAAPMPMPNTGRPLIIDRYGRHWTLEQYNDFLRCKQMQASMRPEIRQQMQEISPPMTMNPQASVVSNRSGLQLAHQEFAALPARQLTTRQTSASTNVGPRKQLQSPAAVLQPQQSFITDQHGRQWTREQLNEISRHREAQKRLATPSKSSDATLTPASVKPSTQPLAHKQSVKKPQKPQKQSRQQPAAPQRIPKTQPPPQPTAPQSVPKLQPPPLEPHPTTHTAIEGRDPKYETHRLHLSALRSGITMSDIEKGTRIRDAMSNYVSAHTTTSSETTLQITAPSSTKPLYTAHNSNNTMDSAHAAALGLPLNFNMRPVLDKVRHKRYDGYPTFSGTNGPCVDEAAVKHICTVDPDGSLRAPEDTTLSETRARLLWELMNCTAAASGSASDSAGEK